MKAISVPMAILDYTDLVGRPEFQDLPYKVETNADGQIIMSPHLNLHSAFQRAVERYLERCMDEDGAAVPEYAVQTRDGVKAPDVVWLTREELRAARHLGVTDRAPKVCVEIVSKSNSPGDLAKKAELYFAAGASEVWTCDLEGNVRFLTPNGDLEKSAICPAFPDTIDPTEI